MNFSQLDIDNNGNYNKLLQAIAQLSRIFTDSNIPLINYRAVENIFCRSFDAINLSRSDTAFDAKYETKGIGIKTFACTSSTSLQKIAEFNSLSVELRKYKDSDLARKLAIYRNDRMDLAYRLYDIESSLYHIVGRRESELLLFESDYQKIEIDKIKNINQDDKKITFEDDLNHYSFLFSKSTLFQRFNIPQNAHTLPIEILENPYELLLSLRHTNFMQADNREYIILPLYRTQSGTMYGQVPDRSGLNQWNAEGRPRNAGELYIPFPANARNKKRKGIDDIYLNFFPPKDTQFALVTPTKQIMQAKVCQQDSKSIMSNPNKDLSDWLLRKTLRLEEGELATREKLDRLGVDSVIIYKDDEFNYSIDIMKTGSYEKFLGKTHL